MAPLDVRQGAGAALVNGLGLGGATAATVRGLVARPPGAGEPVTILGFASIRLASSSVGSSQVATSTLAAPCGAAGS